MATSSAAIKPAAEKAELARLQAENAELEREVERLENALLRVELYIIRGYAVAVYPIDDGFLATCPKLHASDHEATREGVLLSVEDAMDCVLYGMATIGEEPPPPDVR